MAVTNPVMLRAVRWFFVTFDSWSQKRIVALPMPAMPKECELLTKLHWSKAKPPAHFGATTYEVGGTGVAKYGKIQNVIPDACPRQMWHPILLTYVMMNKQIYNICVRQIYLESTTITGLYHQCVAKRGGTAVGRSEARRR